MRNERGVALLVVLLVITLLTITVTEFTYSVQLDQRRVRNSMNALQATLLARSGINIAEGFLAQDSETKFDSYSEEWWAALEEFRAGIELDPTMRLAIRVEDESGKINVNLTRGPAQPPNSDVPTKDAFVRDALRRIFEAHDIDVQIVDRLKEYWLQDTAPDPARQRVQVQDFASLEDFAAVFGIPAAKLRLLRPLLSAHVRSLQPAININTAPAEVLAGILNDAAVVGAILERQQDAAFQNAGEVRALIQEQDLEHANVVAGVFDVRSRLFRLQASALTNADPNGLSPGGTGQTLGVLVLRQPRNRVLTSPDDRVDWTFKPLDWQKEGGARLLQGLFDTNQLNEDRGRLSPPLLGG